MKYEIKKLPRSEIEISFEILPKELEKFRGEAILEFGKELKVEGFRPGHIPEEIVEKKVGPMVIQKEAAEHAIKENYQKAVSENNFIPISRPQVEILKLAPGNPLEFKVLVSILPEIKLPDYKKIAAGAKRKEISVSGNEVKESLSWLQKSRAKFTLKNEPCEKGDFVEIEYSSLQMENGKTYKDSFLLGEGRFAEGFEDNIEGMKDGEEKEFSVRFQKDYSRADLADKEVVFKVKVKSVQRAELPEINGQFLKSLGDFENLEALEKSIKEGLVLEKEKAESGRIRNEILGKISEGAVFDVPEVLVDPEKNRILEDLKDRVSQGLRMEFSDYLAKINKSEKELLDSFSGQARERVKNSLLLREMGKKENAEASEGEIAAEINNFLKRYPGIKTAESQFDAVKLKEYIKEAIISDKTFKILESFIKD